MWSEIGYGILCLGAILFYVVIFGLAAFGIYIFIKEAVKNGIKEAFKDAEFITTVKVKKAKETNNLS